MTTTVATYHEDVPIEKIRIDGGTQSRAMIDTGIVSEYAEQFEFGIDFPPVDIFFDGKNHWLADGFHRYHGGVKAHLETLPATVRKGTQRDAILFSVGANSTHGLKRTNEDKRHAVLTLLNDKEWGKKSQRWIAEKCGVSNSTVSTIASEVFDSHTSSRPSTTTGKDGKQYPATRPASTPTPVIEVRSEQPTKPHTINGAEVLQLKPDGTPHDLSDGFVDTPVSKPPQVLDIADSISAFRRLIEKLEPNWSEADRSTMRQFFTQLGKEI